MAYDGACIADAPGVFDSNLDSAFLHVQPLTFVLGRGQVIKGWDEGISYLKPGSKAFFYVPSPLAYATQARPGDPHHVGARLARRKPA